MIPFIINLETSQDRRDDMVKQMYSINYPYTFIKAVDGRELTEIEYQEEISQTLDIPIEKLKPTYYLDRRNFISLSDKWEDIAPRVGCFLSHYKCLKIAYEQNLNEILILEDDVDILGHFDNIPKVDKDIIYLGATVRKLGKYPNKGYYDCKGLELFGTYAYLIKGKYNIDRIYKAFQSVYQEGTRRMKYNPNERMSMSNVDNFYRRYFHEDSIVMYPPLVQHRDDLKSTISNNKRYRKKYGMKCIGMLEPIEE